MGFVVARRSATAFVGVLLFGIALLLASPRDLWAQLKELSPSTALLVTMLAAANLAAVAARFWRVLLHCEVKLPWAVVWRACAAGNLASLAFIPLLAQVAGRQAVLNREGVGPITTASISALERMLLAATSAAAAIAGGTYLLGRDAVQAFIQSLALPQLLTALSAAAIMVFGFTRSGFENRLIRRTLSRHTFLACLETLAITALGHALIIGAFVVAFHAMGTELGVVPMLAGAAIVSFAASLPLNVGGWGLRELAAVMVFGYLGVDAATAMAGSVTVGLCSTVAVLLTSTGLLRQHKLPARATSGAPMKFDRDDLERTASWLLGMSTAALIYFQMHLMLGGSTVNVNLGDPLALMAFAAVALHCLTRRQLPDWRLRGLNAWLLAFTCALLIAFAVGLAQFGVTPWALGNKLIGWLVLLGYLCAGYLLFRDHGRMSLLRVIEVALVVVCSIVWIKVLLRATPWFPEQLALEPLNFEGFAGNRNAFAFQLNTVLALGLGLLGPLKSRLAKVRWRQLALVFGLSSVLLGVLLTGSRTGIGVATVLLLVAVVWQPKSRLDILAIVAASALLWATCMVLPYVISWLSTFIAGQASGLVTHAGRPPEIGSAMSENSSDDLRWLANKAAVEAWLQSPWLGAGLGSFIHASVDRFGTPLTIHSTPLWLLAEFGMMGVALMGFAAWLVLRFFWINRPMTPITQAFALLLMCFLLFSQLHEMLYQRSLWFFLGALLAVRSGRHQAT